MTHDLLLVVVLVVVPMLYGVHRLAARVDTLARGARRR